MISLFVRRLPCTTTPTTLARGFATMTESVGFPEAAAGSDAIRVNANKKTPLRQAECEAMKREI
jgi:hypothetical protein